MNKKKGFALIESIFMIVFLSVALILVYKAFSVSFQDERKRVYYDNTEDIYETYFVKQYLEENGLLTYLSGADFTNGYVEITCSTITSVNSEYCSF
jgi:Tfp pilus assembly protein PilE